MNPWCWESFLEKGLATLFSIVWEIPLTEEPGGLHFIGSQKESEMTGTTKQQNTPILSILQLRKRGPEMRKYSV